MTIVKYGVQINQATTLWTANLYQAKEWCRQYNVRETEIKQGLTPCLNGKRYGRLIGE